MSNTDHRQSTTTALQRYLPSLLLGTWGLALALMWLTKAYQRYLQSDLWPLLALAAAVLTGLSVATWPRSADRGGGHSHASGSARWLQAGLLLLPLLYAALGPGRDGLGSHALERRAMADSSLRGQLQFLTREQSKLQRLTGSTPSRQGRTDRDATLLDLWSNPETWLNRPVQTVGRVQSCGEPGRFTLYRFLVVCCAADSIPLTMPVVVEDAPTQPPLPADAWVRVTARLVRCRDGKEVLRAERVEMIDAPANPYLSAF